MSTLWLKKIGKWALIILGAAFVVLVIARAFYLESQDKTAEVVAKIHTTKLTLDDVMGTNLPPDPGEQADDTVKGVDANENGIRDDVELAIFKEYPASAKTRAALLQYALALQMEVTQPIVNTETVIAVAQKRSRAIQCIGKTTPRTNIEEFIKITDEYVDWITKLQLDTKQRDTNQQNFYKNIGSYSSLEGGCDLDFVTLPN